jgi:histidinol phosphatase-like enzyme (inositol monophosphatase family)
MSDDTQTLLRAAIEITEAAAAIPRTAFRAPQSVFAKSDESPVTQADRDTETAIRDQLAHRFPDDGIYGEEHGVTGEGCARTWVVDPIDGTKSFVSGVPLFGMLLALVEDNRTRLGVVRFPALGQVYAGAPGLGATCDGAPIRTSGCSDLAKATLYINEGDKIFAAAPETFARLTRAGGLRRMGYDCHPHALLAEGLVDAVVDYDLKPYDYLPVLGLIEAAGGVMTDWQGKPLDFNSDGRVVSAATPELHREVLALLNA